MVRVSVRGRVRAVPQAPRVSRRRACPSPALESHPPASESGLRRRAGGASVTSQLPGALAGWAGPGRALYTRGPEHAHKGAEPAAPSPAASRLHTGFVAPPPALHSPAHKRLAIAADPASFVWPRPQKRRRGRGPALFAAWPRPPGASPDHVTGWTQPSPPSPPSFTPSRALRGDRRAKCLGGDRQLYGGGSGIWGDLCLPPGWFFEAMKTMRGSLPPLPL